MPVGAFEATVRVRVELPAPVMYVGLKLAVTPVGWPDAVNVIAASKPFKAVVVMVDWPLLPWITVSEEAEAEMEKLGVAGPARALIKAAPFMLPQPVTKS